jgi:hypothetical protein
LTYFFPIEKNLIDLVNNCYGVTMVKLCLMIISPLRFDSKAKKVSSKKQKNFTSSKSVNFDDNTKHDEITMNNCKKDLLQIHGEDEDTITNSKNKKISFKNKEELKKKAKLSEYDHHNNKMHEEKDSDENADESFEDLIDSSFSQDLESPTFKQFLIYCSQMRIRIKSAILFNFDSIIFNKYGHYCLLFMIKTWGSQACLEMYKVMLGNIDYYLVYNYPLKIIKKLMSDLDKVSILY